MRKNRQAFTNYKYKPFLTLYERNAKLKNKIWVLLFVIEKQIKNVLIFCKCYALTYLWKCKLRDVLAADSQKKPHNGKFRRCLCCSFHFSLRESPKMCSLVLSLTVPKVTTQTSEI